MLNLSDYSHNNNYFHNLILVDSSPIIELYIAGRTYPNNSVIQLSDSETFEASYNSERQSLTCVTENRPCCKNPHIGEWYYPNNTIIPNLEEGNIFYTHREDDGTLRLYLRNSSLLLLNISQFCCELPNINSLNQKICVFLGKYIYSYIFIGIIWGEGGLRGHKTPHFSSVIIIIIALHYNYDTYHHNNYYEIQVYK